MRFKSQPALGGQVFAVTGVNTVSFAVAASDRTKGGLLGFAVEREDAVTGERRAVPGFKVFRSLVPDPRPELEVSTFDHPVQSFVWDDFTARPDREYRYLFHPVKGRPGQLDRSNRPLTIRVRTEPLWSSGPHEVFFNRGVASSQAYTRSFGDTPIADLEPARRERALDWLSRELDEAILAFVDVCRPGDRLLGCFYEFRYRPVADRLIAAIDRGVDVRLVLDGKVNGRVDGNGVFQPSFPREDNLALLADAGFPLDRVVLREARTSSIQHNKFMVRLAGGQAVEVWTGSTNLSLGGIAGQTNVGHWVRDTRAAGQFARYWELLATDPGGTSSDSRAVVRRKNAELRAAVEALSPAPADLRQLPKGVTALFSPRDTRSALLGSYAGLLDSADRQGCITLAFGVNDAFKTLLRDNTPLDQLVFLLLEKRDGPDPDAPDAFVRINASNNVYSAWGSFLDHPVYQWARETNAGLLGLNHHVSYIHSKFLLVDPLSIDPIVVTGSANFSTASIEENDENMLVVRGDRRVADIYLTEFNRLFNHYYFRSVTTSRSGSGRDEPATTDSLFLAETDAWQQKYRAGTFKAKRLGVVTGMAGFTRLTG